MEASSERQQQILPDSTTTVIINDKQDFIIMNEDEDGAGLQVAADTDPSLTDLMLGKHNFFLSHSSTEAFMTDQRSTSLPGKKILHFLNDSSWYIVTLKTYTIHVIPIGY